MEDLKQLRELLKLLRGQGVLQYQSDKLTLVLSERAPSPPTRKSAEVEDPEERELSPEEEAERLLFYSATNPLDSNQ